MLGLGIVVGWGQGRRLTGGGELDGVHLLKP